MTCLWENEKEGASVEMTVQTAQDVNHILLCIKNRTVKPFFFGRSKGLSSFD